MFPLALQLSTGLGVTEGVSKSLFEITHVIEGCFSLFLLAGTQLLDMSQGSPSLKSDSKKTWCKVQLQSPA